MCLYPLTCTNVDKKIQKSTHLLIMAFRYILNLTYTNDIDDMYIFI